MKSLRKIGRFHKIKKEKLNISVIINIQIKTKWNIPFQDR